MPKSHFCVFVCIFCILWSIMYSNTCSQWYAFAYSEETNTNWLARNSSIEWNLRVLVPGHDALRPSHFAIEQENNIHIMPRSSSSIEKGLVYISKLFKLVSTTIPYDARHMCQLHNYSNYSVHLVQENRVVFDDNNDTNETKKGEFSKNESFLSTQRWFLDDKCETEECNKEEECGVYSYGKFIIADVNNTKSEQSSSYASEHNTTYTVNVYYAKHELPLRLLDLHDRCVKLPYDITKAVVHMLSDKHIVVTMYLIRRKLDNIESLQLEEQEYWRNHVPCQFVIEAWREENADSNYNTSNKSQYTTLLLLIIVIVVRFVPRYILRRQGQIDSTSFHGRHAQRAAEERRRKLLQMQRQLIEKMKAEDKYNEHTNSVKSTSNTNNVNNNTNDNNSNSNESVEQNS